MLSLKCFANAVTWPVIVIDPPDSPSGNVILNRPANAPDP